MNVLDVANEVEVDADGEVNPTADQLAIVQRDINQILHAIAEKHAPEGAETANFVNDHVEMRFVIEFPGFGEENNVKVPYEVLVELTNQLYTITDEEEKDEETE